MKRATWMAEFEREILLRHPEMAGVIDWQTAIYLYNKNTTSIEAAERIIKNYRAKFDE